jgi:hypothetical protein
MDASRFSGTPNRTIFDCRSTVTGWPLLRLGSGPLRASNDVQHTVLSWSSLALTDELNASNLHCRSVTIDCTGFLAISRNESISWASTMPAQTSAIVEVGQLSVYRIFPNDAYDVR